MAYSIVVAILLINVAKPALIYIKQLNLIKRRQNLPAPLSNAEKPFTRLLITNHQTLILQLIKMLIHRRPSHNLAQAASTNHNHTNPSR